MTTTIQSAIKSVKFNFLHEKIKKKIDKLDPQNTSFLSKAKNVGTQIVHLHAHIGSNNPLQDSTRIQTLAYLLDKKVSSSNIADFEKNLFSANLQRSANSRFNSLDKEIIREIVKHIKDKKSVFSLAQVNKLLSLQIHEFCLQTIKHKLHKLKKTTKKIHKSKIRKIEAIEKKHTYLILEKKFQLIVSKIENLTTEDLSNKLILGNVYESIIEINQKIIENPLLLSTKFSLLTNHLLYIFETKLEKAPDSLKSEFSKIIWQRFPNRLNYLPKDILIEIFSHLDIHSLNKLKETCKSFNKIIRNEKTFKSKLITHITLMIEHTNCLISKKKTAVYSEESFNDFLTKQGYEFFNDDCKLEKEKIKKLETTVKRYEEFLQKEKKQD